MQRSDIAIHPSLRNNPQIASRHHSQTAMFMDNQNDTTRFTNYTTNNSRAISQMPLSEITNQKFSPHQNLNELLVKFQEKFIKLLKVIPAKYEKLGEDCCQVYRLVKEVICHYSLNGHSDPYFYKLHQNSTQTKINLLRMFNDSERDNQKAEGKIYDLKQEIKKLCKLIKDKDQSLLDQKQKLEKLQTKIADLRKEQQRSDDKNDGLRKQIQTKNQQIEDLTAGKEKMIKELNQIQKQMKDLNFGTNSSMLKSALKTGRKIRIKVPSDHKIGSDEQEENKKAFFDEDLYRFLTIQALTIEEEILS